MSNPFVVDALEVYRTSGPRYTGPTYLPSSINEQLSGLGFDPPSDVQIDDILYSIDDPNSLANTIDTFLVSLGIGAGRAEADVIVPVQNRLMFNLGLITDQILTGQQPSLSQLQSLFQQVVRLTNNFVQFVLASRFTDRRASGQALNTVMPYVDGSCGYPVPIGFVATPTQFNCLSWGDGTIGGVGTNGMLGALTRAISAAGGAAPGGGVITNPPTGGGGMTTSGFSTPLLLGLGVLAVFLFSRKRG